MSREVAENVSHAKGRMIVLFSPGGAMVTEKANQVVQDVEDLTGQEVDMDKLLKAHMTGVHDTGEVIDKKILDENAKSIREQIGLVHSFFWLAPKKEIWIITALAPVFGNNTVVCTAEDDLNAVVPPLFDIGRVKVTKTAERLAHKDMPLFVAAHHHGDWGLMEHRDKKNRVAIRKNLGTVHSAYDIGGKILHVTTLFGTTQVGPFPMFNSKTFFWTDDDHGIEYSVPWLNEDWEPPSEEFALPSMEGEY